MLRITLTAALLALSSPIGPGMSRADSVPVLAPGAAVETSGGRFAISAPAGSHVAGRVEAGAARVDIDLLTPAGAHFRRLASGASGTVNWQAVAEGDGFILQISTSAPVTARLDRVVPPAAQLPAEPEYLSPIIVALAAAPDQGTETFWAEAAARGTPLVETLPDGRIVMTFLWRGAARNVRLRGGPSNDHEWLERLGASDVWFRSFEVPPGLRLSYQLSPDVPDIPGNTRARRGALLATAQADPLNQTPWPADAPDRFNQDSVVELPDAPPQPGTPPDPQARPVLQTLIYDSPTLGNRREVTLSLPADFDPANPETILLLMFDGERALAEVEAPAMLETLRLQGRLPPVVAVLIPAIDSATRSRELPGNPVFADALADELLPQVLARTGLTANPARTVLAGASYGGLASATVALRRPDVFGNVLAMSGSFWWAPEGAPRTGTPWVAAEAMRLPVLPLRFYLTAGNYETNRHGMAGILDASRHLHDVLQLRGYPVGWREYAGGHDWLVWRGALADGLIALFGQE